MSDLYHRKQFAAFRRDQLKPYRHPDARLMPAKSRHLNHHVRQRANLVRMEEQFIGSARVVHQAGDYTKYANGVAVIRTPPSDQRTAFRLLLARNTPSKPVQTPRRPTIPAAGLTDLSMRPTPPKGPGVSVDC